MLTLIGFLLLVSPCGTMRATRCQYLSEFTRASTSASE